MEKLNTLNSFPLLLFGIGANCMIKVIFHQYFVRFSLICQGAKAYLKVNNG